MPSIIVQGGAGAYEPGKEHERGLLAAVDAGWAVLLSGGAAADAVEAAVVSMEDDPVFNAGLGSSLNLDGVVECDASFMLSDYSCGAVASIEAAKNPILAARLVMERTDHVLLAGEGADAFARKMGLASGDLRTERRVGLHAKHLETFRGGGEIRFMPGLAGIAEELGIGTVGAAAIDGEGSLAAGTSTGGMMMKIPGRVGDGAIIGAGTYASPHGAVSATGHGEPIMRHLIAKGAVDAARDLGIREAVENALEMGRAYGFGFGLIGVEETGATALGFTTQAMSWAERTDAGGRTFLD
ncbi:MAG: isoaspartyl peptidase/L-asparaginase [Candidatus Eisenbacteria bacterium]